MSLSTPPSPDAVADIPASPVHALHDQVRVAFQPVRPDAADIALNRRSGDLPLSMGQFLARGAHVHGTVLLATVALNLLALAGALVTLNVYDRVLPNQAMETLTALIIGAALAAVFEFALRLLRGVLIDSAGREVDLALSQLVFRRVVGARLQGQAGSTGVRVNTLREYETLREFFTSATLTALGDLPFALLFLVIIAVVAGPLVAAPVAIIPLLLLIQLLLQRPMARLTVESFRDTAQKNAVLVETLVGLETLKGLGAEPWAERLWQRSVAEHVRVGLRMRLLTAISTHSVGLVQSLATLALLVHGVILVGQGAITAGALMASMMLVGRAVAPIAQGALVLGRYQQVKVAWGALANLVNAPQERPADADFVMPDRPLRAVSFEAVSFTYGDDQPPALNRASFAIRAGERVGLIGTIGCGKSTALKLLMSLQRPQGGRIIVNDLALGGVDPAWIRRQIGYVEQQPVLFSGTIRSNLILHRPECTDADVIAACDMAGAAGWIARLPRGFDTRLGERGAGLSGGQRQSLALARALVGNPSLLLLDEPTSDMDGRSEADIIARLRRHMGTRTLILVTHRPALLDLVDRLIVFDAGQVVADGPKAEVMDLLARRMAERDAKVARA